MPTTSSPSFSQLRAFVALCDHQHFGEAATALGVSQPSLSQAITALEKRVGGELVERTTRRVLVTSLGEALLPYARDAVLAAEAFSEAASSQGAALSGTMRLGIIPTIAPYLAPVLIDGLREAPPQTDAADYNIRLRNMIGFLQDGDKVKITLRFRGREMAHQEFGIRLLERVRNDIEEIAQVESMPRLEGRQMVMMVAPKKKK